MDTTNPPGLVDIPEAARRLGLKPGTIYRYLHRGVLQKTQIGRSVWLSEAEVERYHAAPRKPGRPKAT
jgi:excisionase family DNA binding protein